MKHKPVKDMMLHARAARCYVKQTRQVDDPRIEVAAFMAIFHPDIKGKRLDNILGSVKT